MSIQTVLSGVIFANPIVTALPAIPNLQTLCVFGSSFDGINSNRVLGGPNLIASGTPAIYSSNYLSLAGVVSTISSIDLNNQRSAAILQSGFTWMVVNQLPNTGNPGIVFTDAGTVTSGGPLNTIISLIGQGTTNSYTYRLGSNTATGTITPVTPVTKWHTLALVNGGGSQPSTTTLYNLTDNQSASGSSSLLVPASGSFMSPAIGDYTPTGADWNTTNYAFAMVCYSPLSTGALQAIYKSLQSILGRRGLTSI